MSQKDSLFPDRDSESFLFKKGIAMNQGTVIKNQYVIKEYLSKGGISEIYLAYHNNLKKDIVVKVTKVAKVNENAIRIEADILKNLHHPCLPQIYDIFIMGDTVYTVMDYIAGIRLDKVGYGYRTLPETTIRNWMTQLADVLSYCHRFGVIHSDIKPENIILSGMGYVTLIDFNISLSENSEERILGLSKQYASPEQMQLAQYFFQRQTPPFKLDTRTDIYSFGALFYYLMTGIEPQAGYSMPLMKTMPGTGYSSGLCSIVDHCMSYRRNNRYKNGSVLLKALRDIVKQDKEYQKLFWQNVVVIVLCTVLMGSGMYCITHGLQTRLVENYQKHYSLLVRAVKQQDNDEVINQSFQILGDENLDTVLGSRPREKAEILHSLADAYYNLEDYRNANEYYAEALDIAKKKNLDLTVYYRDYVFSLMLADDPMGLGVVQEALDQISDDTLRILFWGILQKNGDISGLSYEVDQMLTGTADRKLCGKLCQLMANAAHDMDDPNQEIQWLERAISYSDEINYHRQLASTCMKNAGKAYYDIYKQQYAVKAQKEYESLLDYATEKDLINYAIVLRYINDFEKSLNVLKQCNQDSAVVCMYLAMNYKDTGEMYYSKQYAEKSLALYENGDHSISEENATIMREIIWS